MPIPFILAGLAAIGSAVGTAATAGAAGAAAVATAVGASTAVGTAASAVGTAVAAVGTAAAAGGAGATAVGAIATATTVGAASAVSGAVKMSEAKETKQKAEDLYRSERIKFDDIEKCANLSLEKLGKNKIEIGASFTKFIDIYSRIKNKPDITGDNVAEENLALTPDELNKLKIVSVTMGEALKMGVGSMASGYLISMGISGAAVSAATTATTGVAISSLSGAAATNAALAAFGGGALQAGGGGMALGSTVLGGLTLAPMVAVGGLMIGHKGKKNLQEANRSYEEAKEIVDDLKESSSLLRKVNKLAENLNRELVKIFKVYNSVLVKMEAVTQRKTDFNKFSADEKKSFGTLITTALMLKFLITQNILNGENKINRKVEPAISESKSKLEGLELC